MKKMYVNNTKRAYFFGETRLLPGSNVVEEIDKKKYPSIQRLIDDDVIEIEEDSASAVKQANTKDAVNEIVGLSKGDKKTVENGKKRMKQLDKIDDEVKAAAEAKKAEEKEKQEKEEEGE